MDSRECIELVWRAWAAGRGLDPEPFLRVAHGRRISETLRLVAPALDAAADAAVLDRMEAGETRGLRAAPGAAELVARLAAGRWAVVTSGSRAVATLRLETAGLPIPAVFITSDDVRRGKPDPEPYRTAAARLGVPERDCLVLEDSPTGLAAAKAAGMRVIALLTTHGADALGQADHRVGSLALLSVETSRREPEIVVTWA